jgi:hypothetical protein
LPGWGSGIFGGIAGKERLDGIGAPGRHYGGHPIARHVDTRQMIDDFVHLRDDVTGVHF